MRSTHFGGQGWDCPMSYGGGGGSLSGLSQLLKAEYGLKITESYVNATSGCPFEECVAFERPATSTWEWLFGATSAPASGIVRTSARLVAPMGSTGSLRP